MAVTLTRTVRFDASHHLGRPDWSEQRNREAFGNLSQEHRHSYSCAVTVSGDLAAGNGMVVDLARLDQILTTEVVERFTGKSLNEVVPPFGEGQFATCEALATWLFDRLSRELPPGTKLERVRIAEDDTLHGDCTGLS